MRNIVKKLGLKTICALLLIVYFSVNLISKQTDLMTKKRELAALQDTKREIELEIASTNAMLEESDSETYIENVAREKLGYGYPGEKIFIDVNAD